MVPVAEVSVGSESPHDGGVLDVHLLEDGLRHVAVLLRGVLKYDVCTLQSALRELRAGRLRENADREEGVHKIAKFADVTCTERSLPCRPLR